MELNLSNNKFIIKKTTVLNEIAHSLKFFFLHIFIIFYCRINELFREFSNNS